MGRFMQDFTYGVEMVPPEEVKIGGVDDEMVRKWKLLQELQVRARQYVTACNM